MSGIVTVILLAKKHTFTAFFTGFIFVYLFVLGNKDFAKKLILTLEEPYATINPYSTRQPYDVVVMLGGGTRFTSEKLTYISSSGDRAMLTARLYLQNKTKLLLLSSTSFTKNSKTEKDAVDIMTSLGIPKKDILTIDNARNTTDEIKKLAQLQGEFHWKRIGIVTSAWHMTRTLKLAKKYHLDVIPLPADFRGASPNTLFTLIPNARALRDTEIAMWEYFGILAGR